MGKKKAFIDKKTAQTFRLMPGLGTPTERTETFIPTKEHLEEQHKYGVFYDDDYDYLQHLREVNQKMTLQEVSAHGEEEEERTIIKANPFPPPPFGFAAASAKKPNFFVDEEVEKALEGDMSIVEEGTLEDNFVALAGGVVNDNMMAFRGARRPVASDDEDDDEMEDEEQEEYDDAELFDDVDEVGSGTEFTSRTGENRMIDNAFDQLMEREYQDEDVGELDGDDYDIGGMLEPNSDRLKQMAAEKPTTPEADDELAKQYVRERLRLIEEGVIKDKEETELVMVDESSARRAKWDCESFATQYTNIFNHPTLIREPGKGLTRKRLRVLDKHVEETEDVEMEDDAESDGSGETQSTVISVFAKRSKNETAEEKRLRKEAVKMAKRERRIEKKANKLAFGEEARKSAKGRIGQIKAKPIT